MPALINTNLNSLSAQRQLGVTATTLGTAMQRLSSGLRINSAKDDAAGLAISERFTTQIKGTDQAARNANDGISLAQTAEGALASINDNLQRIRELAVQSANGTNSAADRAALQTEASQLVTEIDRIASQAEFNGSKLLDGTFINQQFQVGANRQQTITLAAGGSMGSTTLGTYNGFGGTVGVSLGLISVGAASPLSITVNGTGQAVNLGNVATDAKAIAAAINGSGVAGLTAKADKFNAFPPAQTSTGVVAGVGVLTLNGININLSYAPGSTAQTMADRRATAMAAINAQSAATGVSARDLNGSSFTLQSNDGRNIVASYSAGTATGSIADDFGLFTGTATSADYSFLRVSYQAPEGSAVTSISFSGAGLSAPPTVAVQPMGTALRSLDISTTAGANSALASIDAALGSVNSARASMGAVQNRFQAAVANLQSSSENLSASRSRITDADFAQETANLSRAQILQQASTAMVAQANQQPQGVLALLR